MVNGACYFRYAIPYWSTATTATITTTNNNGVYKKGAH